MTNQTTKALIFLFVLFCKFSVTAQINPGSEMIIDRIVGIVGGNIIMQSEVDAQYQQMASELSTLGEAGKCKVFEDLLYQKLLLAQAQLDSLSVTDAQIEQEQDRRMNYFIQQFGSEEKFVEFYGKTVDDFKADLKDNIRDLLLAQQMQGKITADVTVTPNEVKTYFENIPEDSLQFINTEVEVGQIVRKPVVTAAAKKGAKDKIIDIRDRIVKGQSSFSAMAALYSQDPGSASRGGLYEGIQRGQFVPEWDAWAFKMKPNEISEVFETVYGYFIVQLIQRRGDVVDARSILIAPKIDAGDLFKAKLMLDTIYDKISHNVPIVFADSAAKYSNDDETKNSGGLILNPFTGSSRFQMDEIGQYDQNVAFAIDKLQIGEMTKPMPYATHDGKQAYRILYLKSRTEPHKLNLKDDYQKVQTMALQKKQQEIIKNWVKKKLSNMYVRITDDYKTCTFSNKWSTN